MITPSVNIPGT